jgi:hypothetical protein
MEELKMSIFERVQKELLEEEEREIQAIENYKNTQWVKWDEIMEEDDIF